jgi:hypothetical protein
MPQLSYSYSMPSGFPGQLADTDDFQALTYFAAAATPFGSGVVLSGTNQAALPGTANDKFLGVVLQTQREQGYQTGVAQYAQGDPLPALTKGRVNVIAEQAVNPLDPVYVRFSANGANTVLGSFRKDADNPGAGATAFQVPQARWLTAASAGGVAVLEINLP